MYATMTAECPRCSKKTEFGVCNKCGGQEFADRHSTIKGGSKDVIACICVNCNNGSYYNFNEYSPGADCEEYIVGECKYCGAVVPLSFYKSVEKGCFIATAVYESEYSAEVITLRNFRDEILMSNILGRLFIKAYYLLSPSVAKVIMNSANLKKIVKKYILTPIVKQIAFKKQTSVPKISSPKRQL